MSFFKRRTASNAADHPPQQQHRQHHLPSPQLQQGPQGIGAGAGVPVGILLRDDQTPVRQAGMSKSVSGGNLNGNLMNGNFAANGQRPPPQQQQQAPSQPPPLQAMNGVGTISQQQQQSQSQQQQQSPMMRQGPAGQMGQGMPPVLNGNQQQQQQQQYPTSPPNANGGGGGGIQPPPGSSRSSLATSPPPPGKPYATGYTKPPGPPSSSYPWTIRQLRPGAGGAAAVTTPEGPILPFPRYGLTTPATPTASGHLLVFGGLVAESARSDLFVIDCERFEAVPVQATGQVPFPRVGHACALLKQVLIVWGGDTKQREEDEQDEALYLFNIKTRDWTRIQPLGAAPRGRYGHAACMVGTSFFVFGGQVDGEFMNDLWCFDMNTLRESNPAWRQIRSNNVAPQARTGHIMMAYEDKLYIFGGTDGGYHYNDVWMFDLQTLQWEELKCTGYIPVPREGHAATMVDGVIYVFGGRDVNGQDLGDLTAFKISTRRWFMFANMGPAPSGRSGHALSAYGKYVLVLGGESNAAFAQPGLVDHSMIHVLDTGKIKYPAENKNGAGLVKSPSQSLSDGTPRHPRMSDASAATQSTNGPSRSSVASADTATTSNAAPERALSPQTIPEEPEQARPPMHVTPKMDQAPVLGSPLTLGNHATNDASPAAAPTAAAAPLAASAPRPAPQRPPRAGDAMYAMDRNRAMSPSQTATGAQPINGTSSAGESLLAKRASLLSQTGSRSNSPIVQGSVSSVRSNSVANRAVPPSDAFYYGARSPTATDFAHARPGSSNGHSALEKELEARDAELAKMKRRQMVLEAALDKAVADGFPRPDDDDEAEGKDRQKEASGSSNLLPMVLKLKQELASLKEQSQFEIDRAFSELADFDRARMSASEEAAYLRTRVAALESGSAEELDRTASDRIAQLEADLAKLHSNYIEEKTRASDLAVELDHERQLREAAEGREAAAHQRADQVEERHARTRTDLDDLHEQHQSVARDLRDHASRLVDLTSTSRQHEADRDLYKTQLEVLQTERDDHMALVDEVQRAVTVANMRADDFHQRHDTATRKISQLEAEIAELKAEVEAKTKEAEAAAERLTEVENDWTKSREEADTLRSVTTGRLGQLLDNHRALRSPDAQAARGAADRVETLNQESASLRKMLSEAGARVDVAETEIARQRKELRSIETDRSSLRAELRSLRQQLKEATAESSTLKSTHNAREQRTLSQASELVDMRARCAALKAMLADHGIATPDTREVSAEGAEGDATESPEIRQLKSRLSDQSRTIDGLREEIATLTKEAVNLRDAKPAATSSASSSERTPDDVAALEAEMKEMKANHTKKMQQLESDYQTALSYVKNTEKVFRRMKDELNRQREKNTNLQSTLDALQGTNSAEAGSRTRAAGTTGTSSGRATPTFDVESTRQYQKLSTQHGDLQKRFETLSEEVNALREISAGREREVEITRKRAREAEATTTQLRAELERVQNGVSPDGRSYEDIEQENQDLKSENEVLSSKIGLLLEMNEPGSARPRSFIAGNSPKTPSHATSIRPQATTGGDSDDHSKSLEALSAEMAEWEQRFQPNA